MRSSSEARGQKRACVFSLRSIFVFDRQGCVQTITSPLFFFRPPRPSFFSRSSLNSHQTKTMDSVLDKVADAVDKAEPAVEKAVRSALGDKAGDAVHTAGEKIKEALHDDVSFFNPFAGSAGLFSTC